MQSLKTALMWAFDFLLSCFSLEDDKFTVYYKINICLIISNINQAIAYYDEVHVAIYQICENICPWVRG